MRKLANLAFPIGVFLLVSSSFQCGECHRIKGVKRFRYISRPAFNFWAPMWVSINSRATKNSSISISVLMFLICTVSCIPRSQQISPQPLLHMASQVPCPTKVQDQHCMSSDQVGPMLVKPGLEIFEVS